jgi:GxxExxY protein
LNHEDTKTRSLRLAPAFDDETERLGREIVDSAFAVHKALGPGLLESAYEACLRQEFISRGISVAAQVPVAIEYKGIALDCGFRLDLLVHNAVIVEVKAIEKLLPIHEAQLLTYLKLARRRLGFLVNFNVPTIKEGIRRRAL